MSDVDELASRWGIETSYFDVQGRRQVADPDTVRRIAEALASSPKAEWPNMTGVEPRPAFQGDGRRSWILAVQLYSVRSRRNWGMGDFSDLAALVNVAAEVGAAGVGVNPLHALFPDRPEDASPYSPNSRSFLNPLYIDVEQLPEFAGRRRAGLGEEIRRLRDTDMVDYTAVASLKLLALRRAYRAFREAPPSARHADFEQFQREGGKELALFACFETLRSIHRGPWWEWPPEWRHPSDEVIQKLERSHRRELRFHQYLQWVAERQLAACQALAKRRGMSIGLYLDLAVGVDAGGADAWMQQDVMLNGLSVGAPPDALNTAGQDWGLTTYNPHGLVATKFLPIREILSTAMRHAGAVRLDHVLGLMRLYVIPKGEGPRKGAYIRFPFVALLDVIAEESRKNKCIFIGEDLGTVPEGFRDVMSAWGVWSYLVVLFERGSDGSFNPPESYRAMALATFSTHDLPTFAGWMSGHDLAVKRAINVDPGETDEERERGREALRRAMFSGREEGFAGVVEFLAATPTRLIAIQIEDVLGIEDQANVPGTVTEHPNWRRRLPVPLEELPRDQRLRHIGEILDRAGRNGLTRETVASSAKLSRA